MLDGAKFEYNMSIVEINDDGPVFRHVYRDEEGKVTGYSEETEQVYADSTIISISQGPKSKLVNTTKGLKATQSGLLETDENGEIHVELRVGKYTVSEMAGEDAEKYILPDNRTVEVRAGETVTVEMHNRVVPETPDMPQTGGH